MKAARWSPVVVAVLILAGCGQTHRHARRSTPHLSEKDNNKVLTVKPGQVVVLTLPSNPSTGSRWRWVPMGSPENISLDQLSHRYVAPKGQAPGAAGEEVWRLRFSGQGGMLFELGYFRPSEKTDNPSAHVFNFTIRIA
jgi:inhibitor of cysteine peptidase